MPRRIVSVSSNVFFSVSLLLRTLRDVSETSTLHHGDAFLGRAVNLNFEGLVSGFGSPGLSQEARRFRDRVSSCAVSDANAPLFYIHPEPERVGAGMVWLSSGLADRNHRLPPFARGGSRSDYPISRSVDGDTSVSSSTDREKRKDPHSPGGLDDPLCRDADAVLLDLLRRHPWRTPDPARARLFVLPILHYNECAPGLYDRHMAGEWTRVLTML